MKNLTASDRKNLIKLASSLPKGSKERRIILAGIKKKAMTAEDDRGNEYTVEQLERNAKGTIKELESLLRKSKDFLKKLQSGSLKEGDTFLDFTIAMDEGYDRTGPSEIYIEM